MNGDASRRLGTNTGHFGLSYLPVIGPVARAAQMAARGAGFEVTVKRNPPPDAVHYLHIGKTAGTTMMGAIDAINAQACRPVIVRRTHQTRLSDLPPEARYFFSIRDPISRFVSGFHSRQSENRPSLYSPWTASEEMVFSFYDTPSQLAEDLFEPGTVGRRALESMCSLGHAPSQVSWFNEGGCFLSYREPVHIVRQEHFGDDFAILLEKMGLSYSLPDQRSNEGGNNSQLSDKARVNLERWYAADLSFYSACEEWLNS